MADYQLDFSSNPAWRPLTEGDRFGYVFLGLAAGTLIGLTIWTYLGNSKASGRRILLLIALRLLALLIAILTTLRPSISVTDKPKQPSTLLVAIDSSESMTLKDESNNLSRWEFMKKFLEKSAPLLESLKNEQQVSVQLFRFDKDFDPAKDVWDPATAKPDGKRTDFGTMMSKLYDKYQGEARLRGLLILSDGADNGVAKPAISEAQKYRSIGCPIYSFAVGQESTSSESKDIALTSIAADPSPVSIKADLRIKVIADALGFEGARTKIKLFIDDKLVKTDDVQLPKKLGNEIEILTKAPDKPGEYRVKVELEPLPGETTVLNNTIESYFSVTKEGVRVLLIYRLHEDFAYLRTALAGDKRFDFVEVLRQTDDPLPESEQRKFDLTEQAYDVIILGNVSPKRLLAINPKLMTQIEKLVRDKGVGLMMLGGQDSFAGSPDTPADDRWNITGRPIADILPVSFGEVQQFDEERIQIIPTPTGLNNFMLKLDSDPKKNKEIWNRLNDPAGKPNTRLQGYTPIGIPKTGHIPLAVARRENGQEAPLMVGMEVGKGRTLAFGVNTLGRSWRKLGLPDKPEGYDLTLRFWKQVVLWLAHQDEVEGVVYARPEFRRLAQSAKQTIRFGVRDKRGEDIPTADIKFQILQGQETPDKNKAKPPERDAKGQFVSAFEVTQPGEYRVVAWGQGKDAEGHEVTGDAMARYIVFPDISDELIKPAARYDILLAIENTANGTVQDAVRRVDRLPSFLEEMLKNPVQALNAKPKLYPDWHRNANSWFLPTLLILFVSLLGFEWGLRRLWGMI
ncbi:hypothetical protein KIH39_18735 [Telmatocola sphagniphila]|uniref:VWFA domain-containing protein n=1 Tax=Telmatocola sphagniphila TaxID=1123043 RepID=A0A8E6B5H0_9BACT|nr:hypothetical protein [Telmatocola sphagniphila]QVL30873.1 hypothetical protein KIH39_18735 [Telmatocola sphagniphila]